MSLDEADRASPVQSCGHWNRSMSATSQGGPSARRCGASAREMIAGRQKARNLPPTGFLNASQQQALLREAVTALGKYDDEQKNHAKPQSSACNIG
jgi:hypothetical protein